MTATSAQELGATTDCKIPNCTGTSVADRGPYTGLCEFHKERKSREMSEIQRKVQAQRRVDANGGSPEETVARLLEAHAPGSLTKAARDLVPAATDLEKKLGRRRQATEDAKAALAAFNEALNELKATAAAALNGGTE